MKTTTIPDGLELVTDPEINKMFSFARLGRQSLFCKPDEDDLIRREEELQSKLDFFAKAEKEDREIDERNKTSHKCAWGAARISRFISRYIHFYKQKPSADRTDILERLVCLAEENNISLPSPAEMNSKKPKKRLISEVVLATRQNPVKTYKVYYDGENIVAYLPGENKAKERELRERTQWDDLFDYEYTMLKLQPEYCEKGKSEIEKSILRKDLETEIITRFYNIYDYDDKTADEPCPLFVGRKLYNKTAAFSERKKRFYRKKDQIRWTAWWTITYDDNKIASETEFLRKLLNKFRNLCTRNLWRIMGVFEHGEKNGRLHFHGFFYIPQGKEIGELVRKSHMSEKTGQWHNYIENTEFAELFGTNEYEDIREATQKDVTAFSKYTVKMLRYMEKGEKVYYSRHIPTEFLVELSERDLLVAFSITCKRPMKRYVVSDLAVKRTNTTIERITRLHKQTDPYDTGLLDSAA